MAKSNSTGSRSSHGFLSSAPIVNISMLTGSQWLGWSAVVLMAAITSLWAFWGIIENFHEGWFYHSFWKNTAMMFGQISFDKMPDKEPPLWETHSPIIYWWTATQPDTASAYLVSYSGWVFPNNIRFRPGYYGFRAVRGSRVLSPPSPLRYEPPFPTHC